VNVYYGSMPTELAAATRSRSGLGQTRPFGGVHSMSGLPKSGRARQFMSPRP
jgi:hypothetical protein